MNSINRRAALRRAGVLAAGTAAVSLTATETATATAADIPDLTWKWSHLVSPDEPVRSRVISGIPATIGYGQPVAIGPIIVQVIIDGEETRLFLSVTTWNALSAVFTGAVVVTDARGLSGRFPITIVFPRTEFPRDDTGLVLEFVLTGTVTLTSPGSPPLARNVGPMTIAVDPRATGVVTGYVADTGETFPNDGFVVELFPADQNPLVATIEVR